MATRTTKKNRPLLVTDSRLYDADRLLNVLERDGIETKSAIELLPALLSSDRYVSQTAESWLYKNARVGIGDLSDESQAERRTIQAQARNLNARLSDEKPGAVAVPNNFRARFHPSDSDINKALDEANNDPGYVGQRENATRLAMSAAEAEMQAKYPGRRISVDYQGNVWSTDPHTFQRVQIDKADLDRSRTSEAPTFRESAPQRYELSNSHADDRYEDAWASVDVPFFLRED